MGKDQSTEQTILDAAERVFTSTGYDGARMQAIADEANINKAMLHYYFKSKDLLFEKVFDEKAKYFFPVILEIADGELDFVEKVESFIDSYISQMLINPFIPLFVINTINKADKKDFIAKLPMDIMPKLVMSYYQDQALGKVKELNPVQFIFSLIGMCVFPFLAKPMLNQAFSFAGNDFADLMEQRKTELKQYINAILKIAE